MRNLRLAPGAITGLLIAGVLIAGCAGEPQAPSTTLLERVEPVDDFGVTHSPSPDKRIERYELYTHCGIFEIVDNNRFYEREGGRLDDGSGNPPDGWGNPTQVGTLEFTDGETVVFTDKAGHREVFIYNPDKTDYEFYCD